MRARTRGRRMGRSGQALVEFALIIPTFMILLLGLLEFGFMFDHTMTISYATREGARSGAAFASGNTTTMTCTTTVDVDKNIVAAVQRVMTAPGSIVAVAQVAEIRIYRALADGTQDGTMANTWTYSVGSGGVGNGPKVDGVPLLFVPATSGWNACTRDNGSTPDSLGVLVRYQYRYITPLASVMGFFGPGGAATTTITDRTVMALNPTK